MDNKPRQNSADRLAKNSLDSLESLARRNSLVEHSIARSLAVEHTLDNTTGDGVSVSRVLLHGAVKETARSSCKRGSQSASASPRTLVLKKRARSKEIARSASEEKNCRSTVKT